MKHIYTISSIVYLLFVFSQIQAQTIWTGDPIIFTKDALADWTLEENQDRLTDSVWITRANNKGIFNIVKETVFQGNGDDNFGPSPVGTEWAFGRTSDGVENLTFTSWIVATTVPDPDNEATPPLLVDSNMVLHLIAENIYLDIKFLSWANGDANGGGAFSYERASNETTSIDEISINQKPSMTVFPNPAGNYLLIKDLSTAQKIEIVNLLGESVYNNIINSGDRINISSLPAGIYYIRTSEGRITSFIKN